MEVKTNRTSFLYENRSGHHNTELKTGANTGAPRVGSKKSLKIPTIHRRGTEKTIAKIEKGQEQTMIYITLHR